VIPIERFYADMGCSIFGDSVGEVLFFSVMTKLTILTLALFLFLHIRQKMICWEGKCGAR
jgi:hypothetical protein